MKSIKVFLSPLGYFAFGMFLILLSFVFYPAIAATATTYRSGVAGDSWLYWLYGNIRLVLIFGNLFYMLFGVAAMTLKSRYANQH